MDEQMNGQPTGPEQIKPGPVNTELVKGLKMLLEQAEKGTLQGVGIVRVAGVKQWSCFFIGNEWMYEIHAGAHVLMLACANIWQQQLQASFLQAQQRGVQRATMGDLSRLPLGGLGRG